MKRIAILMSALVLVIALMGTACTSTPKDQVNAATEPLSSSLEELDQAQIQENVQQITTKIEESASYYMGDLYVMAIGINEYSNNYFPSLVFAANDAENICKLLSAQEGKVFRNVKTMLISDKGGVTPTRDNIRKNMDFFKDVRAIDTVILFAATHRIIVDNVFYLLPSDSQYKDGEGFVLSSCIKFDEIISALNVLGRKMIIIDTHSPNISGKDITVLSACKENEQAIESYLYGGGLFTTSIIEAFEKADSEYGLIKVSSLFDYVVNRVGEMSENKQTPVLTASSGAEEMIIGFKYGLDNLPTSSQIRAELD